MIDKCTKCDDSNHSYGKDVKLVGGYRTTLCNTHRNEWHEHVNATEEWAHFKRTEARLETTARAGNEDRAAELMDEFRLAAEALYGIAKEWCES